MSHISYSPKVMATRERRALLAKYRDTAAQRPDSLLFHACLVAAASFVLVLLVTL